MYGTRIKELRKKHGWTSKELGDRLQVAISTISGYENETRKPDIEMLNKMADLFDVSTDYITGRTDDPTVPKIHESNDEIYLAFRHGKKSIDLQNDEELHHLEEALEMFRALKEKRNKEREQKK